MKKPLAIFKSLRIKRKTIIIRLLHFPQDLKVLSTSSTASLRYGFFTGTSTSEIVNDLADPGPTSYTRSSRRYTFTQCHVISLYGAYSYRVNIHWLSNNCNKSSRTGDSRQRWDKSVTKAAANASSRVLENQCKAKGFERIPDRFLSSS